MFLKLRSYVTGNILHLSHVQSGMQVDAKHTSQLIVVRFSGAANTATVRKCDLYPLGESNVNRIQHMKVVRLLALRTGRLYPPGNIPGTHFC
jgi:hypothetical protein